MGNSSNYTNIYTIAEAFSGESDININDTESQNTCNNEIENEIENNSTQLTTPAFADKLYQLECLQNEQEHISTEFSKVASKGGPFNLFNHHVTGDEMNNFISEVQQYNIQQNNQICSNTKELLLLYETIQSLDKDYLAGIMTALKRSEENTEKIRKTQEEIDKTIKIQENTIAVLKKFKDRLDKNKHIDELDKLWNDTVRLKDDFSCLSRFKERLEESEHLFDIDEIWSKYSSIDKDIQKTNEEISIHRQHVDVLRAELNGLRDTLEEKTESFSKKLTFAYALAGTSIGIAVIELVMLFLR